LRSLRPTRSLASGLSRQGRSDLWALEKPPVQVLENSVEDQETLSKSLNGRKISGTN
jgi:hypothetical protein